MLCDDLEGWDEAGGNFKREGIYVYLWLIHVDIWQKPRQYYKAIIFQLKRNFFKSPPHFTGEQTEAQAT